MPRNQRKGWCKLKSRTLFCPHHSETKAALKKKKRGKCTVKQKESKKKKKEEEHAVSISLVYTFVSRLASLVQLGLGPARYCRGTPIQLVFVTNAVGVPPCGILSAHL